MRSLLLPAVQRWTVNGRGGYLEFKDVDLWERFNVTAAAGKKWLGENTNGKSEFPGRRPTYNNRPESWTAQT